MNMNRLFVGILAAIVFGNFAHGKTLDEEIPAVAKAIAKQLVTKQRLKVATLDFTNIQGMPNELGRFLAEQLTVDMVSAEGITVLDRANINSIMAEHQLTAEGLVKPENAKKLGKFAGVDALLIGNVAAMDKTFTLTVKAISTDTAEVVAAGRCKFDVTEDLMKQFSASISGGAAAALGGVDVGNGSPSSQDTTGIAMKKFDNLEIVLMSVTRSSTLVQQYSWDQTRSIPLINCWFEIHNRDLRNTAVIAANGVLRDKIPEIQIGGYRGGLDDSNGIHWLMPGDSLNGMSSVLCADSQKSWKFIQNNPADVVNYIRKGTKTEFGATIRQDFDSGAGSLPSRNVDRSGKYWTGSFCFVAPGKSIRAVVGFSPDIGKDNPKEDAIKIPQSFQLSMELVIGSVMGGGFPETCKDLRLENLTFDKIAMSDLMKQSNSGVSGGDNPGNGTPSGQDSTAMTRKSFENLEIVMIGVAFSTALDKNEQSIPVINCSFELFNKDMKNTVIIAANGGLASASSVEIRGYRMNMDDSNGIRWWSPKDLLKGMSAVLCFERSGTDIWQNNPTDAVNYIRNGTKVEFGDVYKQKALSRHVGKYWTGAFSTIPPGKSIRVTVGCIPKVGEESKQSATKIPQLFQFGLELVVGSVMEGDEPETAKNLRLENLTFDKVVMPSDTK